jgi:transposase
LVPLLDRLHARPVGGRIGRPRRKPDLLVADRGYDHDKYRRILRARGIGHRIARRRTGHGSGLGRQRWVVERGFAHLHNFRRLRTRYERTAEVHLAFLTLACAILCWRRLESF